MIRSEYLSNVLFIHLVNSKLQSHNKDYRIWIVQFSPNLLEKNEELELNLLSLTFKIQT